MTHHAVWVEREKFVEPRVCMSNDDDGYYVQTFTTPEEVDNFIKQLIACRNEVFGTPDSTRDGDA